MKSNILYAILLTAISALSVSAEDSIDNYASTNDRNLRRTPCNRLSKGKCKSSRYCTYNKYEGACANGDTEEVQQTEFKPYFSQCQGLSSRRCKRTPGCSYDRHYDFCASMDQEEHTDVYEPEPEPYSEWSQGEEGEGHDYCFGKSKRQCNGNSECMYDNVDGVCIPRENVNHGDEEAGEGLRALTPPSPDSAPSTPKGWNEMKRNRKSGPGMHFGCACLFPLPYWMGLEGGYFCWCN